jgi:hypothetical protein
MSKQQFILPLFVKKVLLERPCKHAVNFYENAKA